MVLNLLYSQRNGVVERYNNCLVGEVCGDVRKNCENEKWNVLYYERKNEIVDGHVFHINVVGEEHDIDNATFNWMTMLMMSCRNGLATAGKA